MAVTVGVKLQGSDSIPHTLDPYPDVREGLNSYLCHLLPVGPRANHLTSTGLSFPICQMGIVTATSLRNRENY